MTHLVLRDVCVSFHVRGVRDQSLKETLIQSVGARVVGTRRGAAIEALRNISLKLNEGDRIGLVGHNGAGKTTLLKVCAGIYEPTSGSVETVGKVVSMTDFFMGMDTALTGYENVVRRGIFMGLTMEQSRELIPQVEEFSELGSFLKFPMRTYSSGMFLRLAFSIATSVVPDILVMDELIAAGDQNFASKARRRVDELISRAKIMLIASHDTALLSQICKVGVVMRRGEMAFCGPMEEAVSHYKAMPANLV